jgi:hypothetical protein
MSEPRYFPEAAESPFSEAQKQAYVQDDRHSLSVVLGMMSVIFLIGVLMYSYLAWVTAYGA